MKPGEAVTLFEYSNHWLDELVLMWRASLLIFPLHGIAVRECGDAEAKATNDVPIQRAIQSDRGSIEPKVAEVEQVCRSREVELLISVMSASAAVNAGAGGICVAYAGDMVPMQLARSGASAHPAWAAA